MVTAEFSRVGQLFRRFPYTAGALAIALPVFLAAIVWHIDALKIPGGHLIGLQQSETSEVAIPLLMVVMAFLADDAIARHAHHAAQLDVARLRTLHMTMRTVQNIVSNALTSLYLFRTEAEPNMTVDSLKLFDQIVAETAAKLKAIGDLEVVVEKPMVMGVGIDYGDAD